MRGAPSLAGTAADTLPLEFHGFRAGARLDELAVRASAVGGADLHCRVAKSDRRVTECRGVLQAAEGGARLDLWISAVDSVAGVITLSGTMVEGQLESWRSILERHYGRVPLHMQGPQRMMQWVRRGRMIRLTWRIDRGDTVASVSLVDGRVLDAWGRGRASTSTSKT